MLITGQVVRLVFLGRVGGDIYFNKGLVFLLFLAIIKLVTAIYCKAIDVVGSFEYVFGLE